MIPAADLRAALLVAVAAGFCALFLRLAAAGLLLRFPAFASYALLMGVRYGFWAAGRTDWHQVVETVIATTCLVALLEAFWAVAREQAAIPRRRLLNRALALGALAAWATSGLPHEPNQIREYQRYWLMAQMGMATFAVAGAVGLRRVASGRAYGHLCLMAAHLGSRGVNFINYPSYATTEARWQAYWWQQFTYLPVTLACLGAWWWVMGRRERRS